MSENYRRPIRILHVVGGMNRGGVETWLMEVLRNIDRKKYRLDFLVHTTETCAYDDEIKALGSRIIPCPILGRPLSYAQKLRRILRELGPYNMVHSHVHHFTGWVLMQAAACSVPVRIAHSHTDKSSVERKASLNYRLYLRGMKFLIDHHATHKLAVSEQASVSLFGANWRCDPRYQLMYYGVDFTLFEQPVSRDAVREALGLPAGAMVIGHTGRFVEPKNHFFLVDIMAEVIRLDPNAYLLLVGDGPLRPEIEQKVARLGLQDHVIFAGVRSDVPQLMLGAMDVFLFPSLYEGLPIVGLEAQAAGLPLVLSDTVTRELSIIPGLLRWLSLSQSPVEWADAVLRVNELNRPSAPEISAIMRESPFNIQNSVRKLTSVYEDA